MYPKENLTDEEIQDVASVWLARRDRSLTAAEQDAYLEWLYRDPAHGRAIVHLEGIWGALNKLEQWRPAHSKVPNPDLLAPRRHSLLRWWSTTLAAAAVIALGLYAWMPARPPAPAARTAIIHPGPETMTLADGSLIALNRGAKVDVQFAPAERRVRLLAGEAHFTVAHNADRPFFVDTGKVLVRAVGTAFSVSVASAEVAVFVTEGKVQVTQERENADPQLAVTNPLPPPLYLTKGQRAVIVPAASPDVLPPVLDLTPAQIERAMSWQALRLEFVDLPLGDVAAEFNRYNRRRLVVADETTAAILVAGNFRADNIDAFVRLLDSSFGVTAFPHGEQIVLRKVR